MKTVLSAVCLFLLVATGGCKKDDPTSPERTAATIIVTGFVRDYGGEPIAGAAVIIPGKPAVTSGTDGSFSITGVTTPYDITFIPTADYLAITYKGLTRTDPTLYSLYSTYSPTKTASISGSVPVVSGTTTRVIYVSSDMSWYTTSNAGSGTYGLSVEWRGSATTLNGTIHVLRWANATGIPTSYQAYGERALTISAGGSFQGNNFTAAQLTTPAGGNISGSVTRPSGSYNLTQRNLWIGFGNATTTIAIESGTLGDNLSYTVPSIPGATFGISANASFNSRQALYFKSGISPGSQNVSIPLSESPRLSLPVNGGTAVDTSTTFLFNPGGGTGVNFVMVGGSSYDPTYYILSAASSFTIPNLAQQGFGLPSNRPYSWRVAQLIPFSSIDEAASPLLLSRLTSRGGDFGYGQSETFSFVTRQ